MDNTFSSVNNPRSSDPVERIAEAAHTAVDKSASAIAQGERALRGAQDSAGAMATEAAEHIHQISDESMSNVKQFITRNPGKSVGIAVAGGYLLSRLLKR